MSFSGGLLLVYGNAIDSHSKIIYDAILNVKLTMHLTTLVKCLINCSYLAISSLGKIEYLKKRNIYVYSMFLIFKHHYSETTKIT